MWTKFVQSWTENIPKGTKNATAYLTSSLLPFMVIGQNHFSLRKPIFTPHIYKGKR